MFAGVRERIHKGKGRIRKWGSDYLLCALLDSVVGHNFIVLEKIGGDIEKLENEGIDDSYQLILHRIHKLKR